MTHEEDLVFFKAQLERIQNLVAQGILGRELCPEPKYWHWPIEAHNTRREQIRLREQMLNALVAEEGKHIDQEWERINRP